MSFTNRFTEVVYPLAKEDPDSFNAGTHAPAAYVSAADYERYVLILQVGDMVTNATLDASIKQATDAAGTGAKAITGKAITQLTQAGGDGNQLLCIELRAEELDHNNSFTYIAPIIVTATAAVEFSWILLGLEPDYEPTATTNWEEIVD